MRAVGAAARTAVSLVLIALAAAPVSATIQRFCIQDDRIAAGLAPFSGNFCTANDLTFVLIGLGIQQDGCVATSDTSNILDLRAIVENTGAATRYDAGLWISVRGDQTRCILSGQLCTTNADCSGGSNICASTARWGACSRELLREPAFGQGNISCTPATGGVNLSCGDSPYINDDGDGCGDVRKFGTGGPPDCGRTVDLRINPTNALCNVPNGTQDQTVLDFDNAVVLPCVDRDANGFMEIPTCTSWGQNAADISCPSKLCSGGTRNGMQCVQTADCPGGSCVAPACNICSGNNAVCTSNANCPAGQFCAGTCSASGSFCTDTLGCSPGQTCIARTCQGSGDPCAIAANCPAGQVCSVSTDPICRTQLTVPGTSAKCNCVDGLNSNVPVARLALSCNCAAPTTVRPGFPVTCTVTYNNQQPANCTPNIANPERFRCGTTGYLRFDVDDGIAGPASGAFAVNSVGDSGTTGGTPAVINWTPRSALGTLGIVGAGRTAALNFTYTVSPSAADGPISLATTTRFANKTCSGSGAICEADSQCPVGQTCVLSFSPSVLQPTTTTCNLNVDATWASVTSLTARDDGGRVVVAWETAAEVGTVGFDLLRENPRTGELERLNDRLLPAAQHLPGGHYTFVDETADAGEPLTYAVVELSLGGRRQLHGPFTVRPASRPVRAPLGSSDEQFTANARKAPGEVRRRLAEARRAEAATRSNRSAAARQPAAGRPDSKLSATARKASAVSAAAKVTVVETGLYQLGGGEIATALEIPVATVDSLIRAGKLALTHRGRNVAWHPAGSGSGIVFFGQAIDSPFTRHNVYRLTTTRGRGMRRAHGRKPSPVAPGSFAQTVHLEKDLLPRIEAALAADDDYWFWEVFVGGDPTHGTKTVPIEVSGVATAATDAALTVRLRAFADTPGDVGSRAQIYLNGSSLGPVAWDSVGDHTATFSFAHDRLIEGPNLVEIAAETGIFFLDSFDLSYRRLFEAEGDALLVRGDGQPTVTVSGFSQPEVSVYDIADPLAPRKIEAVTVDRGPDNLYRVSFEPASPTTPYLTVAVAARKGALSVIPDTPSNLLAASNRGEYLVITSGPLLAAAEELADYRRSTGLESLVVDLDDIFDELDHGIASPEAVRRFLAAAFNTWELPPRYVALLGKGSFDYRDNLGLGPTLVPPLMAMTSSGLVASDNRFGDVAGNDGAPEIAVGRLPVVTPEELSAYLAKIRALEGTVGQPWRRRILMVADNADTAGEFASDSDQLATLLPGSLTVDKLYLGQPLTVGETRQGILDAINEGVLFINYVGHGGLDRLAHEGVLRTSDVPALGNGERLPMMAALTCNIGFFAFPGFTSLGEELVLREGGGAAAVWAPSGLSLNSHAVELGGRALDGLLISGDRTIGDLVLRSLRAFSAGGGNPDSMAVFNLLGDPAAGIE